LTNRALRRADGFALPTQTSTNAWLCNWLKIYSAASLLQNRLLCVVVGANSCRCYEKLLLGCIIFLKLRSMYYNIKN
ncbi:MAG: hypothetical protein KA968_15380, partial [Chitinophagaceae bacterium]|nr:hypothetical protein [Chitinophagaceae bacterium]